MGMVCRSFLVCCYCFAGNSKHDVGLVLQTQQLISMLCCCLQGGEARRGQMADEHGGDVSAAYSEMGHQVMI